MCDLRSRLGEELRKEFSHECVVIGAAFNSKRACGYRFVVLSVADDRGKELKGWDVGSDVIAAIHSMLVVFGCRFVQIDDGLGVNSEVLEIGDEGFFECIAVNDARVYLEEKADYFRVLMAEIVGFDEDAMIVEPVEQSAVVDGGVFKFGD